METNYESAASRHVEELHKCFFINDRSGSTLQQRITDLLMARESGNERGVHLNTLRIRSILRDCPRRQVVRQPLPVFTKRAS